MRPKLYPEAKNRLQEATKRAEQDPSCLSAVSGAGPVEELEALLESELDASFALAQTNGTSALETALLASGVGPGDEVILPAYTWPQTLSPVLRRGATPVFADLAEGAVTLSVESVRERLSPHTTAIIGVYLYGFPPPTQQLEEIAEETGASLIFDAAQGFGAEVRGKRAGAFGDYVALSFGRGKLLSVGEGGGLLCRTRPLYERAVAVSQHPLRAHRQVDDQDRRRNLDGVAPNARLSPLLADLATGQLKGMRRTGLREHLRKSFSGAVDTIRRLGFGSALPSLPERSCPSGIEIPLSFENLQEEARSELEEALREHMVYEGGLSAPLYNTPTIQEHAFPLQHKGSPPAEPHETHRIGSCPNCETRCGRRKLLLKNTGASKGDFPTAYRPTAR